MRAIGEIKNALHVQIDGVNLDVQGIFDFSYRTHTETTPTPSAWYVNPGIMVSANRTTPAGLFQVSYAYDQLRNISGDKDQFTGKSAINSHALAFDYVCRLTEQLMGNVGISYITLNDMPTSMDRQFTDLNLRLGSDLSERCSLSAGYSQAIDGRGTNGFDVSGAWAF